MSDNILTVTGTRKGMTLHQHNTFVSMLKADRPSLIVHGAALGADSDVHRKAILYNIPCDIYPASGVPSNIDNLNIRAIDIIHEAAPPLERNKTMVKAGTHVVAFPKLMVEELRSGTWAAIRYAKTARKPLTIVWPDGTIDEQ